MLEAKGRKRDHNVIPKYRYLFDWINEIISDVAKNISTKEKCYWILHGIVDFPTCKVCGKQLNSSSFLNVIHGYRLYCSHRCATQSEDFSRHVSEAQKKCVANDPLHYFKKSLKSKETRMRHFGTYMSNESKAKAKDTINRYIEENPNFYHDRDQKAKATKIANGHDPNWNNREQAAKTRYEKNNGVWESKETKEIRKIRSLAKYGVSNPGQSENAKIHRKNTIQKKYGNDYFF